MAKFASAGLCVFPDETLCDIKINPCAFLCSALITAPRNNTDSCGRIYITQTHL